MYQTSQTGQLLNAVGTEKHIYDVKETFFQALLSQCFQNDLLSQLNNTWTVFYGYN